MHAQWLPSFAGHIPPKKEAQPKQRQQKRRAVGPNFQGVEELEDFHLVGFG